MPSHWQQPEHYCIINDINKLYKIENQKTRLKTNFQTRRVTQTIAQCTIVLKTGNLWVGEWEKGQKWHTYKNNCFP